MRCEEMQYDWCITVRGGDWVELVDCELAEGSGTADDVVHHGPPGFHSFALVRLDVLQGLEPLTVRHQLILPLF